MRSATVAAYQSRYLCLRTLPPHKRVPGATPGRSRRCNDFRIAHLHSIVRDAEVVEMTLNAAASVLGGLMQ